MTTLQAIRRGLHPLVWVRIPFTPVTVRVWTWWKWCRRQPTSTGYAIHLGFVSLYVN